MSGEKKSLSDTKWKRHSNRQQRDMTYQGVIGEWAFYDLPAELSALLYIGQWLHIGKETTFRHGGYRITAGL
ncbi:CRISPR system precrRNA processing endoribonuclease RAMP protein Cas6 [Neisseria sp.]